YHTRLNIIVGDLTKDNFGLSKKQYDDLSISIDTILHTAGNINHYGVWQDFEKVNVNGTKRIIEFAKYNTKKRLNHISTISICHTYERSANPIPFTEFDTLENEMAENLYVKSKLIAENLVVNEKDNLDIKIFRPSNIIQSYETGIFPYGITKDTLFKVNTELSILNILAKNNVFVNINSPILDFSYVDETAKSIYKIMNVKDDTGYIYNVFNPNRISISEYASMIGAKTLSIMDFEKYLIENEDTLSGDIKQLSTLTIAEGNVNQALILSPENIRTTNLLEQLGFKWHSLEKKNLDDIVRFK
ncbi:MAG: SDR family oxidoreductase, partial [Ruminococcus sp.]|nr:SDR family oxidoreductase [Ruminococcus sp.]